VDAILTNTFCFNLLHALCEPVSPFCEPSFLRGENGSVMASGARANVIWQSNKDKVD
jgi:hypothetical protein